MSSTARVATVRLGTLVGFEEDGTDDGLLLGALEFFSPKLFVVGALEGGLVSSRREISLGRLEGRLVGTVEGQDVGTQVGTVEGWPEGWPVGRPVGSPVGSPVGADVGSPVG